MKLQALLLSLVMLVVVVAVHNRNAADAALASRQRQSRISFHTAASGRRKAAIDQTLGDQGLIGPFEDEDSSSEPSVHPEGHNPKALLDAGNGDAGGTSRQLVPRVALLFLSRGPMPHEPSWQLFFAASGKLTSGWPAPAQSSRHVVAGQQLFSAYLHATPGYKPPRNSLFAGLHVDHPVQVQWGQHSVAEAERRLVIAALHDPANQRFALLSESCMFLQPPAVVWLEALAEPRSRMHACSQHTAADRTRTMVNRLHRDMHTDKLTPAVWRKSSQWFVLNRRHAASVASDNEVNPLFVRECWVDTAKPPSRFCVSDEHYIPTLLAYLGLDNETDCAGGSTHTVWQWRAPHPQTWSSPAEVDAALIDALRVPKWASGGCNSSGALLTAAQVLPAGAPPSPDVLQLLHAAGDATDAAEPHGADQSPDDPGWLQRLQQGGIWALSGKHDRRRLVSMHQPHRQIDSSGHDRGGSSSGSTSCPACVSRHATSDQADWLQMQKPVWRRLLDDAVKLNQHAWQGESLLFDDLHAEAELPPAVVDMLQRYVAMGHQCPLFARKFAPPTAAQLAEVARERILAPVTNAR